MSHEIAFAKINLALHVRRREADGYHALETLFAFADDGDWLSFEDGQGLAIDGPFASSITDGGDNLVSRAAATFARDIGGPVRGFRLVKRLPVAAGIGGGSADAAAALRLLARDAGVPLTDTRLHSIAAALGADVPACLLSRPVRGTGRGDRLEPIASHRLAGLPLLLVNPGVPLATGPVFAGWDGRDRGPLAEGDPLAVAAAARNDLQAPAEALRPEIGAVLDRLAQCEGRTLVRMSGSGATCFALFASDAARDAACRTIAEDQPGWWRMAARLRA